MNEAGYDDGLVHGHRWASEPFGYSPRSAAAKDKRGAPPTPTTRIVQELVVAARTALQAEPAIGD